MALLVGEVGVGGVSGLGVGVAGADTQVSCWMVVAGSSGSNGSTDSAITSSIGDPCGSNSAASTKNP